MKIAITGATGFVGSRLVEKLREKGHQIVVLTRNTKKAQTIFPPSVYSNVELVEYTPQQPGKWQKAISGCDGVVNLAGEPITERWTPQHKQEILASRQLGTRNIVGAIKAASRKPKVLVNASAVGYYGASETATFDENSPPGNDFLAEVCQKWEAEAQKVTEVGTRLVIIRIGIVLDKDGGALAKMIPLFKMFAGGPIGDGRQWVSWIHRDDLVNLIITALEREDMAGVFNGTAPNPVTMAQLCKALGEAMHRPSWLPAPKFALELLLGDGAKVVLEGQKVLPKRTLSIGFTYQYETIEKALAEIVAKI
ncbi:MAG: TIGR01777 family protein [Cyanobacteria bacterium J083]|nr:MAG: TIGR01777 family protein [Cyanobacteria bacterium J083]